MRKNQKILLAAYNDKIINFVDESSIKPQIEQMIMELSWLEITIKNSLEKFDEYELIKTEIK